MLAAAAIHPALDAVDVRLEKPRRKRFRSGFELRAYADAAPEAVTVRVERGMTEEMAQVLQSRLPSLVESAHTLHIDGYGPGGSRLLEGVEHVAPALPPVATMTSLQTSTSA